MFVEEEENPPSPSLCMIEYILNIRGNPPIIISMHPLNTCVHPLLKAVIFVLNNLEKCSVKS